MAHKNQAVLDMLEQVRARLADLEEAVLSFEGDLSDMAEKLDRVDDRVYLLEVDISKRAASSGLPEDAGADETQAEGAPVQTAREAGAPAGEASPAASSSAAAATVDAEDDDNGLNILTPEAKEKIGEFAGDLREVAKTGAETFADINEALSDITSPFKAFTKSGRRRR